MAKEKMTIDPHTFACAVVAGSSLRDDDDTLASKQALTRYLSAYLLIEKFNKLEKDQFSFSKSKNLEYLMSALDQVRPD